MPGLEMSLRLVTRQELRLEQRLELRQTLQLRQELVLAQRLIQGLDRYREQDVNALYERAQLQHYDLMLEQGEFESVQAFRDFLVDQAKKKECRPKFSPSGRLSKKDQAKVNIPRLSRCLNTVVGWWGQDLTWARQVVSLSMVIASAQEPPSKCWSKLIKVIPKNKAHTESVASLLTAIWNLIAQAREKSGTEVVAGIGLTTEFLTQIANTDRVLGLLTYIQKATKEVTSGLETLQKKIPEILEDKEEYIPVNICFVVDIYVQRIRYRTAMRVNYSLTNNIRHILRRPDLVEKLNQLANLPVLMTVPILGDMKFSGDQDMSLIGRLDELAGEKYFQKSKDAKRAMWRGINVFRRVLGAKEALKHFVGLSTSAREMIHGLQALEILDMRSWGGDITNYPHRARTMDEFVLTLQDGTREAFKTILGFSDENIDRLAEDNVYYVVQRNGLLDMCLTYATLCRKHNYQRGVELSATILKKAMEKHFLAWRYSHERSQEQLGFLNDDTPWRESLKQTVILGVSDAHKQRFGAIRRLGDVLAERWQEIVGYPVDKNLDAMYLEITNQLRKKDLPSQQRKMLGKQAGAIKKEYSLAQVVRQVMETDESNYNLLTGNRHLLERLAFHLDDEESRQTIGHISLLLDDTDFEGLSHIVLEDTDAPYRMMNVGRAPIQSCMRWNEWTHYNHCLPAYVVDANKKVLLVYNNRFKIIIRSVLRLLPFKFGRNDPTIVPVLLVERLYTSAWTSEIGAVMLQWVIAKAEKISEANDTPVILAVQDERLQIILKTAVKGCKKRYKVRQMSFKLPPSMNKSEYSDTLGMALKSGARTKKKSLLTIFIGSDDE